MSGGVALVDYVRFPLCSFCVSAWDAVYARHRSFLLTPVWCVEQCSVGGCDPTVWDHLDLRTGWPNGLMKKKRLDWDSYTPPPYDDRVFHRRKPGYNEKAPWRAVWAKLARESGMSIQRAPEPPRRDSRKPSRPKARRTSHPTSQEVIDAKAAINLEDPDLWN